MRAHYENSLLCSDGKKAYNSLNTPTNSVETEEKEQEDNPCPSGRTSPTVNDAEPRSPTAPLYSEGIIDSEEHVKTSLINPMITWGSDISQDNVCLIPPVPNEEHPTGNSDNPPAPNKELLVVNSDTPSPPSEEQLVVNSDTPSSPIKRHLFGMSQLSVCEDGHLPTPVLDMLSIIEEKGLHTEKIFRTIANKSFRTLKEKLDDGEEVSLTEESVLVVASVLKEFVRCIQGSLLRLMYTKNGLKSLIKDF